MQNDKKLRSELILNVLMEHKDMSDSGVAKEVLKKYPANFKNVQLDSIRKRVGEARASKNLQREIKDDKIIIDGTDIVITKADWLTKESQLRIFRDKKVETDKIVKVLSKELDDTNKFIDTLMESIPSLPVISAISNFKVDKSKKDEECVLMLSDIHAGEVVNIDELEGYGEYNFDIFVNRLYYLCEKIVEVTENQRNVSNIRKLWIDMLGDMVHGELHQKETNEYAMIPTILNVGLVMAQAIAMLSKYFVEIEITGVVGNHGRREPKPPSKNIYDNWDYMVYQIIALHLKNYKHVKFNIPISPSCIVERMGYKYLLTHGDSIKGGFAGIPVYGLIRAYANEQEVRRINGGFDYFELGHYHEDVKVKNGKMIVNASMVGNSGFNIHKLHVSADPMQKFFGINKVDGISWERNMQLKHAPKQELLKYSFSGNPVYSDFMQ